MRRPKSKPIALFSALLASVVLAGGAAAQAVTEPHPLVKKVVFNGVKSVDRDELLATLATQPTHCKNVLYTPFCLITHSHIFTERHTLDRDQVPRDVLRIRVFYFRHGWRDAQATATVKPDGQGVDVIFDVVEGQPTLVATLAVVQTDSTVLGRGDIDRARIPRKGGPLDLIQLDSATIRLENTLWEKGYADAVVHDSSIVEDTLNAAAVQVTIDPKRRTTVDTVIVLGNEGVSSRTIRRLLDLSPGQLYRRSDVLAAQRRLYASELFRQALVTVPEETDSAKTVQVSVLEAPFHQTRLGFGFNTTEFVQTQAQYTIFDWIGSARRLDLTATVGNLLAPQLYDRPIFGSSVPAGVNSVESPFLQPTWQLSAQVTQPWLFSTKNSLGLGVFAHRRSVLGVVIDRGYGADLTFTRRLADRVPLSLTYHYEQAKQDAGQLYFCVNFGLCRPTTIEALSASHALSPLWLSGHADRADDPLEPTRGYTARLDAEYASALTLSDFRYERVEAEYARYFPIGRAVLAARVRGGWVHALASTAQAVGVSGVSEPIVHPSKRFYAGGSRSVRGYGENQLGPRVLTIDPAFLTDTTLAAPCTEATIENGTCDPNVASSSDFLPRPLGGNSVLEGSVELRLPVTDNLVGAVFVDGASVGPPNVPLPGADRRSAVTPGFGIRYRSPIGPIRVDLGVRPRITEDLPVYTQVPDTASGHFRLVQLATPKHYDPTEGRNGFLSSVFSRLELHLSIGEAY